MNYICSLRRSRLGLNVLGLTSEYRQQQNAPVTPGEGWKFRNILLWCRALDFYAAIQIMSDPVCRTLGTTWQPADDALLEKTQIHIVLCQGLLTEEDIKLKTGMKTIKSVLKVNYDTIPLHWMYTKCTAINSLKSSRTVYVCNATLKNIIAL